MDKFQHTNKLSKMATTVDSILENAKALPRKDVGELISKLSLLMDEESLGDHDTLLKTLEERANGPFEHWIPWRIESQ